eukprot:4094227-Pleurochrysis_carterae.AAC.1
MGSRRDCCTKASKTEEVLASREARAEQLKKALLEAKARIDAKEAASAVHPLGSCRVSLRRPAQSTSCTRVHLIGP